MTGWSESQPINPLEVEKLQPSDALDTSQVERLVWLHPYWKIVGSTEVNNGGGITHRTELTRRTIATEIHTPKSEIPTISEQAEAGYFVSQEMNEVCRRILSDLGYGSTPEHSDSGKYRSYAVSYEYTNYLGSGLIMVGFNDKFRGVDAKFIERLDAILQTLNNQHGLSSTENPANS